jgi:PrtD family type I secretion system ABC transporter
VTETGQDSPFESRNATVRETIRTGFSYVWAAFAFTVVINILMLVSPVYMLQVYDRVLTSNSVETLIVITIIAVFLLTIYIAAEGGRKRVLANAGQYLGKALDKTTLQAGLNDAKAPPASIVQNVGNLSRVQGFFINATIAPVFDAPFAPFFIAILFWLHPLLGTIGLIGAIILLLTAVLSDRTSRKTVEEAAKRESSAQTLLAHTARQRGAIVSMGMGERAISRWQAKRHDAIDESLQAVNTSNFLGATARSIRQILQVLILGAGAWLVLQQQLSPGAIIAGSIIMGRGLAPIDQAVGIWRQLIRTRQSWRELKTYLEAHEADPEAAQDEKVTRMPRPDPVLRLEEFSVAPPGAQKALLPKMTFELPRGSIVAILGPSGAGKTSFLQTLAGAWEPAHGIARLGNRDLHTWHADDRGRFIGYMPQNVELLTGTVFENIARFTEPPEEDVFQAALQAACHDLILSLPKGYDTPIGEGGMHLSAGQRQSIGLARAFFGTPALMLLDEPTAHLDTNMASALLMRFGELAKIPAAERQTTCFIATHDMRLINAADRVMVIQQGKVALMPKDEYLQKISDFNQKRSQSTSGQPVPPGTGSNDKS